MRFPKKVDGRIISEYLADGYLIENRHPTLPLRILNYSRKTQFEKKWDDITLMCRGLILDDTNNVIAWGFPKFFNYEQHDPKDIPTHLSFEVFEKMDGSLGIAFYYKNEWIIATRGSFTSDQAIRAQAIFSKLNTDNLKNEILLFEIIYPENRIVCDYGTEEKLVLLAVYCAETGIEYPYEHWGNFYAEHYGLEVVKKYDGLNDIDELRKMNEQNREGFILKFSNGMRVKVKFADYCRLHSIITNVSTKDIWEYVRDGKDFNELLDRVPDEFDIWVREQREILLKNFMEVSNAAISEYRELISSLPENFTKKDFALEALKSKNSHILFNIHAGKDTSQTIWKMVEPEWSKPFLNKTEEYETN